MKFLNLAIFSFATFAMAAPSGSPADTKVSKEQGPGKLMLSMVQGEYWEGAPEKLSADDVKSLFKDLGRDVVQFVGNVSTIESNGPPLLKGSNGGDDSNAAIQETLQKLKSVSSLKISSFEKRDIFDDIANGLEKVASQAIIDVIIFGILSFL